MLGETNETLGKFKAALKQNGAEFPVSWQLNIIQNLSQQLQTLSSDDIQFCLRHFTLVICAAIFAMV